MGPISCVKNEKEATAPVQRLVAKTIMSVFPPLPFS